MNLDLDKLEQLARAAGDQFKIPHASAAEVLELVRQVRALTAQAEALHKVGAAMGLLAGADLTKETIPAILELFERCRLAEEDGSRYRYILSAEPMDPGVWDALEGHGSVVDGEFDQADYAATLNANIDRARAAQGATTLESLVAEFSYTPERARAIVEARRKRDEARAAQGGNHG